MNGDVFSRQIATLVFELCRSWRSSNRAAVLGMYGRQQVFACHGYPHIARKIWVD